MERRKLDSRVKTLLENQVKLNHRSLFMIIGDEGYHQVVTLLYLLNKVADRKKKRILWCYHTRPAHQEGRPGRGKNRKKRKKTGKKLRDRVAGDDAASTPQEVFDLFLSSYDVRFCYYSEVNKIVGQTYDALVLQDFEELTPNVLSRCVETVNGQGVVVMLIAALRSLSQLYTMQMSIHARLRTGRYQDVVPRFNERFILSLASNPACLIVDDQLRVLPTSTHAKSIEAVHVDSQQRSDPQLDRLKSDLQDTPTIGPLVQLAKTVDQARALLLFLEACQEKTLRSTVALTAPRGRGKSAALGLAIAGAVGMGYSNIFVTSPSPENLHTLFAFLVRGLEAMNLHEHQDYELVTSEEDRSAVVRVNVFHTHRQTVQYVHPSAAEHLAQAELVVIDEAAAIPLPWVRRLCGPYLVFLSSTVNGYEGTGRSLSLKLLAELRTQTQRQFRETTLQEPIRYSAGCPIEEWLGRLLCLDAAPAQRPQRCPHPQHTQLYYVNKDALFSGHQASEQLLHELVGTFVASHYKNSPNDLMLLSDAPAHHVFVLLPPIEAESTALPSILCAVHVALEGRIARDVFQQAMQERRTAQGDLIPWTLAQQFQDGEFAAMSGVRVVRIAVHPQCQGMGYGSRALRLVEEYYRGGTAVDLVVPHLPPAEEQQGEGEDNRLLSEVLAPRQLDTALLASLMERPAEQVDWIGASYGVTLPLARFWRRNEYSAMYTRLTSNATTGEHTTIVLKSLGDDQDWVRSFHLDYRRRLCQLLAFDLRDFSVDLALALLSWDPEKPSLGSTAPAPHLTPYDVKRLQAYSNSQLDHHAVLDLVPQLVQALLCGGIEGVRINSSQMRVLVGVALQKKSLEALEGELSSPASQLLAFFGKAMRKFARHYQAEEEQLVAQELQDQEEDEEDDGEQLPLADSEFAVPQSDRVWQAALQDRGTTAPKSISVAVPVKRARADEDGADEATAAPTKKDKKKKKKKKHKKRH